MNDGRLVEPLTKEEEEEQISGREASKVFFKEYGNNTGSWKERKGFEKRKRNRLDDSEAEKLR